MLKVGREHKLQDVFDVYLGFDVVEFGWSLWDGEQEDVTFFVGCLGIIRTPKGVSDFVLAIDSSKPWLVLTFLEFPCFFIWYLQSLHWLL